MQPVENTFWWKLLDRSVDEYVWGIFGLILAILVMIWSIMQIRAWWTDDDDPAEGDHQLLTSIRDLKREGDLTDDEYRSIKGQLVNRLGETADPSE